MNQLPDQLLIANYLSGDEPAFAELVRRHLGLAYSIALRYLHNGADADDATQEVFVKVWKNLKRFDSERFAGQAGFENWLARIAKNTCLDILKKKRAIPFSALASEAGENSFIDGLAATTATPAQLAESSSFKRLLDSARQKLSPAYQKVLSLYYDDELNFREISEQLDEPLDTVKSRHRRAIIALKKFLQT